MDIRSPKQKFDDCPYSCINGKVMNTVRKEWEPCPYCSEKKKELARDGVVEVDNDEVVSLSEVLGITNEFLNTKLVYGSIIPDGEKLYIEEESLKRQEEVAENIYLGFSLGEKLSRSFCFGFGNKGRIERFVYPMLSKAYLSGLSVYRFISCTDYRLMMLNLSSDLSTLYECDVVIMMITNGCSKADIESAKGLMQNRAMHGKGTIFVTTWSIEACSVLLGYWEDESYFLAAGCFVEYKRSGKKHSRYISDLTGVENSMFEEEEDKDKKRQEGVSLADLMSGVF